MAVSMGVGAQEMLQLRGLQKPTPVTHVLKKYDQQELLSKLAELEAIDAAQCNMYRILVLRLCNAVCFRCSFLLHSCPSESAVRACKHAARLSHP